MHPAIKHLQDKFNQEKLDHQKNRVCPECGGLKDKRGIVQGWDYVAMRPHYFDCDNSFHGANNG